MGRRSVRPVASVKGDPQSAVFAMGKFALRGLAQSMARELAPKGIHVAHFVIAEGVRNADKGRVEGGNAAAHSYSILRRSLRAMCTWSNSPVAPGRGGWSCDPWVEGFGGLYVGAHGSSASVGHETSQRWPDQPPRLAATITHPPRSAPRLNVNFWTYQPFDQRALIDITGLPQLLSIRQPCDASALPRRGRTPPAWPARRPGATSSAQSRHRPTAIL